MATQAAMILDTIVGMKRVLAQQVDCESAPILKPVLLLMALLLKPRTRMNRI